MSDEQDYIPVAPTRKKKVGEEKAPQMARCWNGLWGCEGLFPIRSKNKFGGILAADGYNPSTATCMTCCNREAADYNIAYEDLGFLMTAMQHSRSMRAGKIERDAVLDGLRQMGFETVPGRRMVRKDQNVNMAEIMEKAKAAMKPVPKPGAYEPVPEHLR